MRRWRAAVDTNCSVCQELWNEYGRSTREHLHLERQLQAAENSRDTAARAALLPEVRKAAEARTSARERMMAHEVKHR